MQVRFSHNLPPCSGNEKKESTRENTEENTSALLRDLCGLCGKSPLGLRPPSRRHSWAPTRGAPTCPTGLRLPSKPTAPRRGAPTRWHGGKTSDKPAFQPPLLASRRRTPS